VGLVDEQERPVPARHLVHPDQVRQRPVHGEHPVGDDHCSAVVRGERLVHGCHGPVRHHRDRRAREPAGVDERGVVAAVGHHERSGSGEDAESSEVREVPGREHQRRLGREHLREALLELEVQVRRTGDEA
jgi:hypothetical protein